MVGDRIEGKDLVAMTAIVVCGFLISQGFNGAVISLFSTVIGWYFGSKKRE